MSIDIVKEGDLAQILELVQSCYRSELSNTGWTTDADFLEGERTTIDSLREEVNSPCGKFFKYTEDNGKITGCVNTEIIAEGDKMIVGFLCVHPSIQGKGLGRKLMAVVENHALCKGCTATCMKVVTIRTELIAWYERQGYKNIGEISPFISGAGMGTAKIPLEFCTLEKQLA